MWCSSGTKEVFLWIKYGIKLISQILWRIFRYLEFKPSRADQDLWIKKSEYYERYAYISTHVNADKNPSKYMHDISMLFKVRDITESSH